MLERYLTTADYNTIQNVHRQANRVFSGKLYQRPYIREMMHSALNL